MQRRTVYTVAVFVLLVVEIVIALFVHDNFVRPYLGDVLVTVLLCTMVRICVPDGHLWLPLGVFCFACLVEVGQSFHIVKRLGLSGNRFFSTLIGGTFDWRDILCYGIGCLAFHLIELLSRDLSRNKRGG